MQIPSIPPPIITNAQPQDAVAKAVPSVQALAPLVQNPVTETPKSEKFNQSRGNKDRNREQGRDTSSEERDPKDEGTGDQRGTSLNIRV